MTVWNLNLPVMPPVCADAGQGGAAHPEGALSYEPKWDGFRSIIFRDGDEVEIGSRNEKPMTRYFPEMVAAVKASLPERCVIDGEIVVVDRQAARIRGAAAAHPSGHQPGESLAQETPASFMAFDLLALGDDDYTQRPFAERRAALVAGAGRRRRRSTSRRPRPTTRWRERWFEQFEGAGLDGVVAKPLDGVYEPDKRVMFKIKHERTADCVVAGYRVHAKDPEGIGSLLLGCTPTTACCSRSA